jgi:hypothetical protein
VARQRPHKLGHFPITTCAPTSMLPLRNFLRSQVRQIRAISPSPTISTARMSSIANALSEEPVTKRAKTSKVRASADVANVKLRLYFIGYRDAQRDLSLRRGARRLPSSSHRTVPGRRCALSRLSSRFNVLNVNCRPEAFARPRSPRYMRHCRGCGCSLRRIQAAFRSSPTRVQ